tara:strand:- start:1598 stop:3145 length:1548 start_codon:yes stop_codon:yes gene_type:complete
MNVCLKYLYLILIFFSIKSYTQLTDNQIQIIDSLKKIVATTDNDSLLVNALVELDNIIFLVEDNQDLNINFRIIDICEKFITNSKKSSKSVWYMSKLSIAYNNIANFYENLNKHQQALKYYIKSLKVEEELGNNNIISITCNNISNIYKLQQNYKEAIEYHEKSLLIEERMRMELKKNFALQQQADSIKHADEILIKQAENLYKEEQLKKAKALADKEKAEKKSERQRKNGLIVISALILCSLALVFLQLKKVRKGKVLLEIKQKEITDSINYAKRLQDGILVPFDLVQSWLSESFILFKPKDIVSGDFYWIEKVGNRVYFAVADCTGHGIPGALVSIICSNALSKSLYEDMAHEPSKILDNTREIVENRFVRSANKIQDGMDISLCCLDVNKKIIHWSGAMNPLWVVKKGSNKIEELKPDRQSVGLVDKSKPFTNHKVKLEIGDSVYLFSDGYQDQFGGKNGKKYMKGKMKKFVLSIQDQDMQTQLASFEKEFNDWKGSHEQIDDVCVMGVRIT